MQLDPVPLQLKVAKLISVPGGIYTKTQKLLLNLRQCGEAVKIRVEHGAFDENEVVLRCKALDDEKCWRCLPC